MYEDFLDELLIEQCIDYSVDQYENQQFHLKNQNNWGKNIVEDSGPVYVHVLKQQSDLYQLIYSTVKNKTGYTPASIMFYYWMPTSHICWHNDLHQTGAVTIYLNREWDANHGGLFLYQLGIKNYKVDPSQPIHAIYPLTNRAVLQIGGEIHAVSCTSSKAQIRRTIQIFLR